MPIDRHYQHSEITEVIIREAYHVHNVLGFGFLESVYENALRLRLYRQGLQVLQQHPVKVFFEKEIIGHFQADLVINDKVVVELKSVASLHERHEVHLVNYLRATHLVVGLLINFGQRVTIKRRIFSNHKV